MNDLLRRYRQVDYKLPATYLAWDMFGAGLENFGRGGKPVEHPLRAPRGDEILLRVDAIGLCFSDAKLLWAGAEHPRIRGRDLAADPTVPGHEAALTVVKVGADWKSKFSPGQRFIIQADIFVGGVQRAFGYVQRGALAQFAYAGPDVLAGDDGCYLLPLQDATGYAEAALVEPWACVENAYQLPARTAPLPGGRTLVVAANPEAAADFSAFRPDGKPPALLAILGAAPAGAAQIKAGQTLNISEAPTPGAVARLAKDAAGGEGFDDIVLLGPAAAEIVTACDAALAKDGHLVFVGSGYPPARIDIGRVHYHGTRHLGAVDGDLRAAYAANARMELKAGGRCWMAGAAGPMGQMHVQRALEIDNPPALVYCSDLSSERLEYMEKRLAPLAAKAGTKLVCVNNRGLPDFDAVLDKETNSEGFDDAYVHAPVAAVVEQCARHLAGGSVLNVFAGVALGTMAAVTPDVFACQHTRMIGSSGSTMDAIRQVLGKVEAGKLATRMSLAALGGIEAGRAGLKGVKENAFLGKTVLFPFVADVPLLPVDRLAEASPAAAEKLENGAVRTNDAEAALFAERLRLE